MAKCLKCHCEDTVKNRTIWRKQRFKCKSCGYQFTRETKRGCEDKTKMLALILYFSGSPMNMTGKIIEVSAKYHALDKVIWSKSHC